MNRNNFPELKSLFFGLLTVLLISSCTGKYDEYNSNPNEVSEGDLERDYLNSGIVLIPQMQMNVFPIGGGSNNYQRMQNLIGDIYSGYMGASAYFSPPTNGCTYFLIDDWNKVPFTVTFTKVMPAWKNIKDKAEEKNPAFYAVAEIIKVMAMHRTTDIYGPLPYLNFGHGGLATPYDSQQSIYESFFADLDKAVSILTEFVEKYPGSKPIAKFDLIYGGDFVQWIKFANSLKLRLAIRLAYADPVNARKYAEEAVSNAYGVISDNAGNALLKSIPGTEIAHPLKMIWSNYKDTRMGANMESFLRGYNDPRLPKYFSKATFTNTGARDYMGVRNGISMTTSSEGIYETFSAPNIEDNTPVQWMCAAEVYFLRAEGAIRGWSMGGTAQNLYNQGISTSLEQYGVSDASYLNNSTSKAAAYTDPYNAANNIGTGDAKLSTITIRWNEPDAFEVKLEKIITQKWLAMFPDGQEAWSEFRRTRYPKVFPVVVNNSGSEINTTIQIRRIKYPLDEYTNNGTELRSAINNPQMLNGPDIGGTKLWWDQKP